MPSTRHRHPHGPARQRAARISAGLHWSSGILILIGMLLEQRIPASAAWVFFLGYPSCFFAGLSYLLITHRWPGGYSDGMVLARWLASVSCLLLGIILALFLFSWMAHGLEGVQ